MRSPIIAITSYALSGGGEEGALPAAGVKRTSGGEVRAYAVRAGLGPILPAVTCLWFFYRVEGVMLAGGACS